jgi:serine/tyrosine/threonine adenylyltransferase
MPAIPQPSEYHPDPAIRTIADFIADPVRAADFPKHVLRFRNTRWDQAVGLAHLADAQWTNHFGRFVPLPDNLPQPLALRYHGHQFRTYNPDIGDGRGFLLAQLRDNAGRLLDLGTKGSGQTPYSRFGDGRLTLKGGMREVLATEMLEALGVETSKSFSLIETGEALDRNDEPSPTRSAVLVRLSHGHVRIGSFQRLAAFQQAEEMKRLVAYSLERLYAESGDREDAPVRLIRNVVKGTSRLAASYMAAGFVHGVLNSDNIAITAESFDYGPWRFTPKWEPGFTAAYFDQTGLYAFGRQPQAIHWDVVQLAVALRTIIDAEALVPELEAFPAIFANDLHSALLARLGVQPMDEASDRMLAEAMMSALGESDILIDRFFFDWRGGRLRAPESEPRYAAPVFASFREKIAGYVPVTISQHDYWTMAEPCSMHIEEVERIWAQIDKNDDWGAFHEKIAAIRRMGEAMRG